MPLVKAQCTNCGAALEVDSSKEAAVCPYCNTPYIVEKAINNYTTNITNNIQAQNVTIVNRAEEKEFEIDGVELVKYIGHQTDVVIPDYIRVIGEEAFHQRSFIKRVTLNKGLRSIGENAFAFCSELEKVTVEDDPDVDEKEQVGEIHFNAFFGCDKLEEVILPARIVYLDDSAFSCCVNLKSITCLSNTAIFQGNVKAIMDCISLEHFYCENVYDEQGNDKVKIVYYPISPDDSSGMLPDSFFENNSKFIKEIDDELYAPTRKSGCYIATCVYGSYDCPQVWTLRRYRDDTLGSSWFGRAFIRTYYAISPTVVRWFGNKKWFKKMWQGKLDKMVKKLNDQGVENTPYKDKHW